MNIFGTPFNLPSLDAVFLGVKDLNECFQRQGLLMPLLVLWLLSPLKPYHRFSHLLKALLLLEEIILIEAEPLNHDDQKREGCRVFTPVSEISHRGEFSWGLAGEIVLHRGLLAIH